MYKLLMTILNTIKKSTKKKGVSKYMEDSPCKTDKYYDNYPLGEC